MTTAEKITLNDDDHGHLFNAPQETLPSYTSMGGAIQYVYLLALGEFDVDGFDHGQDRGENKFQKAILNVYFLLATFLFVIHLLNMLIAIMGEAFNVNSEKKHMLQSKYHLQLVLDNMWMSDVIKDRKKIKYLVVASANQED